MANDMVNGIKTTEQQQDKYGNHAQVWELLPWYINGSLSAEEKQQIVAHTAICLICRKELGLQAALRESVKKHELDEVMVAASFDRLSAKLHHQDPSLEIPPQNSQPPPGKNIGKFADALHLWLRRQTGFGYSVAATAVLAIVVILPRFAAEPPLGNTFRTLSNTLIEAQAPADFRIIFAESVSESERDAILDSAGLGIVSGPDDRGLYFVKAATLSASPSEATLEQLRSHEEILFAELVNNPSPNSPLPGER